MTQNNEVDRRQFTKAAAAVSALAALNPPKAFGGTGTDHEMQLALVGAGGRGTGAVADAIAASRYPIKLTAIADLFQHRLDQSLTALAQAHQAKPELVDVPQEHRFVGLEAYKLAMDSLNPGDIVILATPLAFREVHFQHAIDRGLHVFMEKPIIADGPTAKRMFELAKKADAKKLKVAVGLMIRHCRARQELFKRIQNGEIGELISMYACRMHGPVGSCFSTRKPADRDELTWQIERFHSFLWASGGLFSDFYVHQIDEVCWMKNAWPVSAQGVGGRHFRGDYVDQNFDSYAIEYTFEDGAKYYFDGRTMLGCRNDMSSIVHGTKGSAFVSTSGHTPGKCRTFKGQKQNRKDVVWAFPQPEENPYTLEWKDLIQAILDDAPYNEAPRAVEACLVASMGRMAAHTGQEVTYQQMLNCPHEMAPGVADFAEGGPAPVMSDSNGRYPVPNPGTVRDREYGSTA